MCDGIIIKSCHTKPLKLFNIHADIRTLDSTLILTISNGIICQGNRYDCFKTLPPFPFTGI